MDTLTLIASIVVLTFATLFIWIKRQYNFWKDLGVETKEPTFFLGNLAEVATQKISFAEMTVSLYNHLKSKGVTYGGCYFLFRPLFVPIDPELIKKIMVKDFEHFVDRGVYYDEENDPLTAHLFSLEGTKWKNLRAKLTPTFTSGKMKMMFSAIIDCSKNLLKEMDRVCEAKSAVEIKDILARFNTDVIASVAFGLETNSITNPDAEFHIMGDKVFAPGPVRQIFQLLMFAIPSFGKLFKLKMLPSEVSEFYFRVISDTVAYREKNNVVRKDFMQLLIQLKNKGTVNEGENLSGEGSSEKQMEKISLNELAAQAFIFFLGGFETSSTTETFCLYELAINHDIQNKLRNEIEETLKRHNDELTYEAVAEMNYLDKVVNGIDPERFSEENKRKTHPFAYLPFGEGPRICIGMRFGLMQTKIGIISLIKNYRISVNEKTQQPIQFDPKVFILTTQGGMWLDFEKL